MAISMKRLVQNASQTSVMLGYLRSLANQIGHPNYLASLIRREHGTGTGFFGVSNTGSTDCAKERIRGLTDSLAQTNRDWRGIAFISESCLGSRQFDFRNVHRVEHTREVMELFLALEEVYVLGESQPTSRAIASFVIEHQVVSLIRQEEQIARMAFDPSRPFSKYSARIFHEGRDVSACTYEDVVAINKVRYRELLRGVADFDFTALDQRNQTSLIRRSDAPHDPHTLPPMDLAVTFHDNELELVLRHYRRKLEKRITPGNKWYGGDDADRFRAWIPL